MVPKKKLLGRPAADSLGLRGNTNYEKLGIDGFVSVGVFVSPGDAIIGKSVTVQDFERVWVSNLTKALSVYGA